MIQFELYERKDYYYYYSFQKFLGEFAYFYMFDSKDRLIGKYLIRKGKLKEFKSINRQIKYVEEEDFHSFDDIMNYFKETETFVTFYWKKIELSGIINNIYDTWIALDEFRFDAEYNGISLVSLFDVDEISWGGIAEQKLDKFSTYQKKNTHNIIELLEICCDKKELCEMYRQKILDTFLVGLCSKLDKDYFLMESIDMLGIPNGYVLIHQDLVDYFSFRSKYLSLYNVFQSKKEFLSLPEFFEYLKESKEGLVLSDYNGKEYYNAILIDYNDKYIFFTNKGKKHKLLITKIDIIDTCHN